MRDGSCRERRTGDRPPSASGPPVAYLALPGPAAGGASYQAYPAYPAYPQPRPQASGMTTACRVQSPGGRLSPERANRPNRQDRLDRQGDSVRSAADDGEATDGAGWLLPRAEDRRPTAVSIGTVCRVPRTARPRRGRGLLSGLSGLSSLSPASTTGVRYDDCLLRPVIVRTLVVEAIK